MVDVVENKYLQSDDQPIVLSKELSEHHVVGEQPLVTSIPATSPTSTELFGHYKVSLWSNKVHWRHNTCFIDIVATKEGNK